MALTIAVAMPPLLVSGLLASRWVGAERERLQERTQQITDRVVGKIDSYLTGKIAMLQALATSPSLETRDFARLDRQARELLDLQGLNIVMRDHHGQQLINTRVPFGTPLPRILSTEADRIVTATHRPIISDLYDGVMARGPLIRVIVPVIRQDRVLFTLTASLPPETLAGLLRDTGVRRPHHASVSDRQGRIIARADHDPSLVGKTMASYDHIRGERGTWEGINMVGADIFGSYRRSPVSELIFTVGIDKAALNQPLYRSYAIMAALAMIVGLLGFAVSWFLVRQVLRSQQVLISAASALGTGEIIAEPVTAVIEANAFGKALSAASVTLHEQAARLTALNQDLEKRVSERTEEVSAQARLLQTTLDNMAQGLMVVNEDGTVPICNRRATELLDLPVEFMVSRPNFKDVIRHQAKIGEFDANQALEHWIAARDHERTAHSYVRTRPNGRTLEVKIVPLHNGAVVRTYTDITVHKKAEQVAHEMSRRDPLTGLGNRTLFLERLAARLTDPALHPTSVLCLDLDRFKAVNDTFGHLIGDALLKEVSDRIQALAGPGDTVARLAGDEFAVILATADRHAAGLHAEALLDAVAEPMLLEGFARVSVGCSIGIAVAPEDGATTDDLLKSADLALYRAKDDGRSTYRRFEPAMDVAARERRALEHDLSQALPRGEFEIHYQPVIGISGLELRSFEALLRWKHPVRGYVPPSEFIPVAEATNLIPAIGEWVLRTACLEASHWPDRIGLAVNISPLQFHAQDLMQVVVSALVAAKLRPDRLEIEITEAVLMQESDVVLETLRGVRQIGVRIALDDFGTGYSSLSYLHRFPLDRIKIDRSFVQAFDDPTMRDIARTIIELGNRLGTAVTAEGVETQEQLDFVRQEGCDAVQGFLFSRPLPVPEARHFIQGPLTRAA